MNKFIKCYLILLLVAAFGTGCEGIIEPSVDQEKETEGAINTADDLEAFVLGAHDVLNEFELYGRDFYVSADVMSDNAWSNENSGRFIPQRDFNFTENNSYAADAWQHFYEVIANANIVINAELEESGPRVDHIKGQAYGLRAFSHMNLLLAFGQQFVEGGSEGIPYITTYNEGNLYPARESASEIWSKIVADFETAVSMMDPQFDSEATTFGYYAAKALQSRLYLYTGDFSAAISAADEVINSGNYSLVPASGLVEAWASGSGPNSIFELAFTGTDRLGTDNIARIYLDTNYGDVEVTQDLYDAYDDSDVRKELFTVDDSGDYVSYRVTGKYVDELGTDNVRIIRYAEVLLNKAEALARSGSEGEALTIINNLSAQRGSSWVYSSGSPENVLAERRLELAMEGHRLYDLARHGRDIRNVTIPENFNRFNDENDLPFGDYRFALPIPRAEINANPNMTQNQGY